MLRTFEWRHYIYLYRKIKLSFSVSAMQFFHIFSPSKPCLYSKYFKIKINEIGPAIPEFARQTHINFYMSTIRDIRKIRHFIRQYDAISYPLNYWKVEAYHRFVGYWLLFGQWAQANFTGESWTNTGHFRSNRRSSNAESVMNRSTLVIELRHAGVCFPRPSPFVIFNTTSV